MADIFISYSRADRDLAQALAKELTAAGLTVWWDIRLVGSDDFRDVIEKELTDAKACVVIWSPSSVSSKFVRDEAELALRQGKLIAARTDSLNVDAIPLGFRGINAVPVADAAKLLAAVQNVFVRPAAEAEDKLQSYEIERHWEEISASTKPDDFKNFIERYPEHTKASLARLKLEQLQSSLYGELEKQGIGKPEPVGRYALKTIISRFLMLPVAVVGGVAIAHTLAPGLFALIGHYLALGLIYFVGFLALSAVLYVLSFILG